jgi:hypothetical protein
LPSVLQLDLIRLYYFRSSKMMTNVCGAEFFVGLADAPERNYSIYSLYLGVTMDISNSISQPDRRRAI